MRTTLDFLHSTSVIDWPIIPHCQLSSLLFFNMHRLSTQSSFHSSCRSIGEGRKIMQVVTTISASNQMIATSKDIDRRLNSNEFTELVKSEQNDPPIWMKLVSI